MNDGNVHHSAKRTAHIRPVHGIIECTPTVVYPRDVVCAHLCAACTTQVLLRRSTLECMHALDELEFNRRAVMLGITPRARPPWSPSLAGAGKQIRVATKVEIPQRVAVTARYPH
jgi:hypothetical protein